MSIPLIEIKGESRVPRNEGEVVEFYNSILGAAMDGRSCGNASQSTAFDRDMVSRGIVDAAVDARAVAVLGLVHRVFRACKALSFRKCNSDACATQLTQLGKIIPQCPSWPGLQRWILQIAACQCAGSIDSSEAIEFLCQLANQPGGPPTSYETVFIDRSPTERTLLEPERLYCAWAKTVSLGETLRLLSWLHGIASGSYKYLNAPPMAGAEYSFDVGSFHADSVDDGGISRALGYAAERGLCPYRLRAIAMNLEGGIGNVPALITHAPAPYMNTCTWDNHKYCSFGPSHKNCSFDFCEVSVVNPVSVDQLHQPECSGTCEARTMPPPASGIPPPEGTITVWNVDSKGSELQPINPERGYMAIAHVWSDGTGGFGKVPGCQYEFFCKIARSLKCRGLWWDAICIPQDRNARPKAIHRMHEVYAGAKCTLIHDLCLASSEWRGADAACFSLAMSTWFTRGWTVLELARSSSVKVLFHSADGYVLKDLDEDMLAQPRRPSSLSRQVASSAIATLRQVNMERLTINGILTSLGPRFTSYMRDKAVITGLFTGIDTKGLQQHEIYQSVVIKLGEISANQLFHSQPTAAQGYHWLPASLYSLPVAQPSSALLKVDHSGDVIGEWHVLYREDHDISKPYSGTTFIWGYCDPLVESRVRNALSDHRKHIMLAEKSTSAEPVIRGMVVRVLQQLDPSWISCRYIGTVRFKRILLARRSQPVTVRIHMGTGDELEEGEVAINYVKRSSNLKYLVDSEESRSTEAPSLGLPLLQTTYSMPGWD